MKRKRTISLLLRVLLGSCAAGAILISNPLMAANHPPVATSDFFVIPEDTTTALDVLANDHDADGDALITSGIIITSALGRPPCFTGSFITNVIVTPCTNFNGTNLFFYLLSDLHGGTATGIVTVVVTPVNDAPIAQSQSISLNEDTTASVALVASDVDGDVLNYDIIAPAHGSLIGAPPNLTYRPDANCFGPDSFTFRVSDGQTNSTVATVLITVRPVNDPPVAHIHLSPLNELPGITNLIAISPNNLNVTLVLDGSQSADIEDDPRQFSWLIDTNLLATRPTITNVFALGSHTITLTVSDGTDVGHAEVTVEVLTAAEASYLLAGMVLDANLARRNEQSFLASLNAAAASFDRGNFNSAVNQLQAFQNKVRAQIAPVDPVLAQQLMVAAQEIIGVAEGRMVHHSFVKHWRR